MLVTDIKRVLKNGKEVTGFYMNGFMKTNLDPIPEFITKKAWDCVGIVSGHGKVRIGKSTLAAQICHYVAWILAGGEMITDDNGKVLKVNPPKNEVRFNLKENLVFSAEDLQERADSLYKKYGKNQVILYDEGRQGLDSARAMENINKGMEDFFQECGFMGHFIVIVLPNFFKLHEDYAVARSLFLVDVFADKDYNRGFYNFYNERQKEYLYFFGKKRLGVSAKYSATNPSFWGKFTKWLPFDKDEYEEMKGEAMEKKRLSRGDRRIRLQRDALVWVMNKEHQIPVMDIKDALHRIADIELNHRTLENAISKINEVKIRASGYT
jgi:hypothetical protein